MSALSMFIWLYPSAWALIMLVIAAWAVGYYSLRNTPKPTMVAVWLCWAVAGFCPLILYGIDLLGGRRDEMIVLWQVLYWGSFGACWLVLPLMKHAHIAPYFPWHRRLCFALCRYAVIMLIFLVLLGGFVAILVISEDFTLDECAAFIIVCGNTVGIVINCLLLGYGLGQLPKTLFRMRSRTYHKNLGYTQAFSRFHALSQVSKEFTVALQELYDLEHQAFCEQETGAPLIPYLAAIRMVCPEEYSAFVAEKKARALAGDDPDEMAQQKAELLHRKRAASAYVHNGESADAAASSALSISLHPDEPDGWEAEQQEMQDPVIGSGAHADMHVWRLDDEGGANTGSHSHVNAALAGIMERHPSLYDVTAQAQAGLKDGFRGVWSSGAKDSKQGASPEGELDHKSNAQAWGGGGTSKDLLSGRQLADVKYERGQVVNDDDEGGSRVSWPDIPKDQRKVLESLHGRIRVYTLLYRSLLVQWEGLVRRTLHFERSLSRPGGACRCSDRCTCRSVFYTVLAVIAGLLSLFSLWHLSTLFLNDDFSLLKQLMDTVWPVEQAVVLEYGSDSLYEHGNSFIYGIVLQVLVLVSLGYQVVCALYALFRMRIFHLYHLVPKASHAISTLQHASLALRCVFPLLYCFSLQIRRVHDDETVGAVPGFAQGELGAGPQIYQGTGFQDVFGQLELIPVMGKEFNLYLPLIVPVISVLTFFSLFSRLTDALCCSRPVKVSTYQQELKARKRFRKHIADTRGQSGGSGDGAPPSGVLGGGDVCSSAYSMAGGPADWQELDHELLEWDEETWRSVMGAGAGTRNPAAPEALRRATVHAMVRRGQRLVHEYSQMRGWHEAKADGTLDPRRAGSSNAWQASRGNDTVIEMTDLQAVPRPPATLPPSHSAPEGTRGMQTHTGQPAPPANHDTQPDGGAASVSPTHPHASTATTNTAVADAEPSLSRTGAGNPFVSPTAVECSIPATQPGQQDRADQDGRAEPLEHPGNGDAWGVQSPGVAAEQPGSVGAAQAHISDPQPHTVVGSGQVGGAPHAGSGPEEWASSPEGLPSDVPEQPMSPEHSAPQGHATDSLAMGRPPSLDQMGMAEQGSPTEPQDPRSPGDPAIFAHTPPAESGEAAGEFHGAEDGPVVQDPGLGNDQQPVQEVQDVQLDEEEEQPGSADAPPAATDVSSVGAPPAGDSGSDDGWVLVGEDDSLPADPGQQAEVVASHPEEEDAASHREQAEMTHSEAQVVGINDANTPVEPAATVSDALAGVAVVSGGMVSEEYDDFIEEMDAVQSPAESADMDNQGDAQLSTSTSQPDPPVDNGGMTSNIDAMQTSETGGVLGSEGPPNVPDVQEQPESRPLTPPPRPARPSMRPSRLSLAVSEAKRQQVQSPPQTQDGVLSEPQTQSEDGRQPVLSIDLDATSEMSLHPSNPFSLDFDPKMLED